MTRGTHSTCVVAVVLACTLAACGVSEKDGGLQEASIGFVDPMDDGLITPDHDLNGDIEDGIQYDVIVRVDGISGGTEIVLHRFHESAGGEWEDPAMTDGSGTVTFPSITFWMGTADDPSVYRLRAYTADGEVQSETIRVDIALPFDTTVGADPVPEWERNCRACEEDTDCNDGLICPTREECGYSMYAERKCCYEVEMTCDDGGDPCMMGVCSEEMGGCIIIPLDDDGDGHSPAEACGGSDCDDDDYSRHPGARETCDGKDNDCDWAVDEDAWLATGDTIDLSGGGEPSSASLASGDTSWGVAWIEDTTLGRELHAGVITPGDPGPVASTTVVETFDDMPLDAVIVSVPGGFAILVVVPWWEGHAVIAYPMSASGTVDLAIHDLLTMHTSVMDLTAASSPTRDRIGLFFRSTAEGDYEIFYQGIDWTSPPTAGTVTRLTTSIGFSGWPSAVGTSSGFAVAWEDDRDGNMEIYFAMLAPGGALDGPATRVTTAPGNSQNVALGWSPEDSSGTETIPESYGLAWMDSRAGPYDLLFTCLDGAGAATCPEIGIADGPDVAWYPALTYQGYPGQFAMAYAGKHDALFQVHSTAVSTRSRAVPADIDVGPALDDGGISVSGTDIADAGIHPDQSRGVIWIEGGAGTSVLRFQQLSCGS